MGACGSVISAVGVEGILQGVEEKASEMVGDGGEEENLPACCLHNSSLSLMLSLPIVFQ